jgi:alkyl hydroperoxide reductase subunit AhpC
MIKQVVTTVKMVPINDAVSIPFVQQFIDPLGQIQANAVMETAAAAMLDELQRVTKALQPLRERELVTA